MEKNILKPILITGLWLLITVISFAAETPEELRSAIEVKTQALQEVSQKIIQTQKELEQTASKGKSLQKEIKTFDQTIGKLNLNIRASELNIEKLGLEINSLQYDIDDIRYQIGTKKSAISQLLKELNHKDSENFLILLLKNKSLAESLNEAKTIVGLNLGLASAVNTLQEFNQKLNNKLDNVSGKKQKVELENKNLKNQNAIAKNQKSDRQTLLVQTKNQEKNYQILLTDLEKQQNAISEAIEKIEDELRSKFDASLLPVKRPGVFAWPVVMRKDGGTAYITQNFGEKSSLYRGKAHNGLDIGGVGVGTQVFAAEDGKVVAVDNNDRSTWNKYQYGKYVLIEHNNNLTTLYAHLSSQTVRVGDLVKRGDLIGYTGKTGYATGPHLHFGVYWTPSLFMKSVPPAAGLVPVGVNVAPEDYL